MKLIEKLTLVGGILAGVSLALEIKEDLESENSKIFALIIQLRDRGELLKIACSTYLSPERWNRFFWKASDVYSDECDGQWREDNAEQADSTVQSPKIHPLSNITTPPIDTTNWGVEDWENYANSVLQTAAPAALKDIITNMQHLCTLK